MNKGEVTVIDVREVSEFIKSHIEDSVNLASTKFDKKINELDRYKNDLVIVACQTGTRSPAACSKLIKNGFTNVHMLKGGIQAWEDLNLPIRKSKPKHRA
jgi:rhodanese-related sulfurtransferase